MNHSKDFFHCYNFAAFIFVTKERINSETFFDFEVFQKSLTLQDEKSSSTIISLLLAQVEKD
jgi:hypothetical protein